MTAVIFDLDGTLVDSAAALRDIANTYMAHLGLPALDLIEARGYIGSGSAFFLRSALQAREAFDPAAFADQHRHFETIYTAAPGSANTPFPAVDDVLRQLARDGYRIGLCTNKPGAPTRVVLEALGWNDLFGAVVCGDTLPQRKPDPEPLRETARRLGAGPVVYVGDSEVDAATAEAAGMPFLLFTEGYRKASLAELTHTASFSDFSTLKALIAQISVPLPGT